jgi:hypothetical protein
MSIGAKIAMARQAFDSILEKAQLAAFDAPNERYHKFLPSNFFCSCLFIELRPEDALHVSTLRHLLPAKTLRGYFGADILRGVSRSADDCGQFRLMHLPSQAEHKMPVTNSLLHGISCTDCVSYEDLPCALQGMLMWSHINFARFAFDILALLDGTFEIGRVSSFYGFGQQPPSE